jgi:hypothetical protein
VRPGANGTAEIVAVGRLLHYGCALCVPVFIILLGPSSGAGALAISEA